MYFAAIRASKEPYYQYWECIFDPASFIGKTN